LTAIVAEWYATKVRVLHKDPKWKKLLYFWDPKSLVAHVARAILPGSDPEQRIRPILSYYNPTGSSQFVHGQTTRDTYDTRHSHVNLVVVDSGWEGKAAKVLDDLADEGRVLAWVKNAFLDFRIPYTDKEGAERDYLPDFIVRAPDSKGNPVNLILEITGMTRDKTEKKWAVEKRWLPAINAIRTTHDWPRWEFLEIAEDIRDARNDIIKKLGTL
jgi:type III restriction enzyme